MNKSEVTKGNWKNKSTRKLRIEGIKKSWLNPEIRAKRLEAQKVAFKKIKKKVPVDKILCACGCGKELNKYDDRRRARTIIRGHNVKKGKENRWWKGGISKNEREGDDYKKWRLAVFKRDGYICQMCFGERKENKGKKKILNAHHIAYWKEWEGRRFAIDNGVTLCLKCHKQMHRMGNNYKLTEK